MSDTKSIKNSLISKCSITVLCLVLVSPAEFNFVLVSVQLVRSHLEPDSAYCAQLIVISQTGPAHRRVCIVCALFMRGRVWVTSVCADWV